MKADEFWKVGLKRQTNVTLHEAQMTSSVIRDALVLTH